jgi:hypothetical protein
LIVEITMRRLTLWTRALLLFFTAIVGITKVIGQSQPPPKWIAALHLQDCALPCWINIIPGQTSGSDAFAYIDNHFLTTLEQTAGPTLENGSGNGGLRLPIPDQNNPQGYVGLPFLVFRSAMVSFGLRFDTDDPLPSALVPRLGDIASLLGPPSCVAPPAKGIAGWMFVYDTPEGVTEVLLAQGDSLNWFAPIYLLYIIPHGFSAAVNCPSLFRWGGLASERYR